MKNYAIIFWIGTANINTDPGMVYDWYESLTAAIHVLYDMLRTHTWKHAVVVKML